jgi:hypothetical protein
MLIVIKKAFEVTFINSLIHWQVKPIFWFIVDLFDAAVELLVVDLSDIISDR